jgi:hypothetical protein
MKHLFLAILSLGLAACATRDPGAQAASAPSTAASAPAFGERVGDAATTPLSDLNLVRAKIPEVLLESQKGPYVAPAEASCTALAAEVKKLDAALGPDLDVPPSPNNPGLVERGSGVAGDAAIGALRGAAENVVPFRGWVRKLTGAERYSREVAAAIAAGTVRRAFLKGLGQAAACAAPAAPHQRQAQSS